MNVDAFIKKYWKDILIIGLMVYLISLFFLIKHFNETEIACGRITKLVDHKGDKMFHYDFIVNGTRYGGAILVSDLNRKYTLEELKKIECLKVKYNPSSPFLFSTMIDERIVEE